MKNLFVFKRMTAALLAVVVLVSLLPVLGFATETEVFTEDFSSDLSNWTEDVGAIEGGAYTVPGDTINYIKDITLTDVAVSADVTVYNSQKPNGFTGGSTAYVTARADGENGSGYDFGIGVNASGKTFVRLSRRDRDGVSKVLYQDTAAIDGIGTIRTGTVYNIKIATTGNLVIGLINDVQVIQVEDTTFQSGSVGVRTLEGEAKFDNIKVVEVPERRVDSIVINTHSEEISKVGKPYFTATVYYNSVYGTLAIDQDTKGVTVTGLDCTTGEKTVTVSYGGCQATFPVTVVNAVANKVIYETGFDTADGTWEHANNTQGYDIKEGGGYATGYMPANPADVPISDTMARPRNEMKDQSFYSVETRVAITADANTPSARKGFASLRFASVAGGGLYYEWRLTSSGSLSVYYGSTLLYSNTLTNVIGESFEMGKFYTLKAEVYEDVAILYVNGKRACLFTAFDGEIEGFASLRCGNGNARYDSFKAVAFEPKGDYAVTGLSVVTANDGVAIGSKMLHNDDFSQFVLMVKYADGTVLPCSIKADMLSWYDPTGQYDQVIRVTKGSKSCYINYHYLPYMFYDNFDVFLNPEWKITAGDFSSYSIVNDRLRIVYNSNQTENSNVQGYCGDETWGNYSVSVDVFFDQSGNANSKTRYADLVVRMQENGDRYELRFESDGINFKLQLLRFENGAHMAVKAATSTRMTNALDGAAVSTGAMYNLRVDCVGNAIKCYFQDKLMMVYLDETDNPFMTGKAGFRMINNNVLLDNFVVTAKNSSQIVGYDLTGAVDGEINLWQGNEIAAWENMLIVHYADGTHEEVDLLYEMIGPYSKNEPGKHSVDITYSGVTKPIVVNILARPEYVADVQAQILAFADAIDAGNASAFLELKALYDSLTPYEATSLSAEAAEKHTKLLDAYDRFVAPELAGTDTLDIELFNTESDLREWTDSIEGSRGVWIFKNGVHYQAQVPYARSGNSWQAPPNYGNISGISADIMCLNDMMHAGVAINIGEDGYYHCRISSTTVDAQNRPVWEFQFYRKISSGHVRMAKLVVEAYDQKIGPGDWYNLMLTMEGEYLNAYLNGQLIYTFQETEQIFNLGEAGIRISTGDALIDNVRVYGIEQSREQGDVYIEPYIYNDDFEDETAGKDPSHWQEYRTEAAVVDNWRVFEKDGNKVYGTNSLATTSTYLHAFDKNPSFTVKFMAENWTSTGKFGFITRMAPSTAYHIVGYDTVQQKWYVHSQTSEAAGPEITYQEGTFVLEPGRWYTAELVLKGATQSLKIDGVEVFALDKLNNSGYGRLGFYTMGANMYVDDYSATYSSGEVPQDGLIEYVMYNNEQYSGYMEIEKLPDGSLLGMSSEQYTKSYNDGLTWTEVTDMTAYADLEGLGGYCTFLKMSNGEYLQIINGPMTVRVSKDMDNWTTLGAIMPEERTMQNGQRVAIIHVNSATEVVLEDGTHRIFMPIGMRKLSQKYSVLGHYTEVYYSDDFGRTWTMSETDTREIHPGYTEENSTTWCEVKIIKCADGTLRMYYSRNKLGCMQYVVSEDNGVTWGGLQQIPEIQLPITSSAFFEDPSNPGTYYMICCSGKARALGEMNPRNHFILCRTTDGQNWEFLMSLEWMNDGTSVWNGIELYQILDPSLFVDEKYVYLTVGRSEREQSEDEARSHQGQRVYYLRVEKDKLNARPWDSSTIADMYYPKTIEFEVAPQQVFGISDLFVCAGTLKLTDFLGNVTYEDIRLGATVYTEPNMFALGKQTVELRYKNGYDLSYEIEVRPKADIAWTIEGEGTVDPKNRYIIEGTTQTVNLIPADGWKLVEVWVGDDIVETPNNQLVLTYDKNGLDIWVVFEEVTIFDSPWFYVAVGGGVLIAAGAAVFFILKAKKKKNATPQQPPEA